MNPMSTQEELDYAIADEELQTARLRYARVRAATLALEPIQQSVNASLALAWNQLRAAEQVVTNLREHYVYLHSAVAQNMPPADDVAPIPSRCNLLPSNNSPTTPGAGIASPCTSSTPRPPAYDSLLNEDDDPVEFLEYVPSLQNTASTAVDGQSTPTRCGSLLGSIPLNQARSAVPATPTCLLGQANRAVPATLSCAMPTPAGIRASQSSNAAPATPSRGVSSQALAAPKTPSTSSSKRQPMTFRDTQRQPELSYWDEGLQELHREDIQGPGNDPQDSKTSNGRYEESWIWTVQRSTNVAADEEKEFNKDMRVEWTKSRARTMQWGEEYLLFQEEMRRVLAWYEWKAAWWEEQAMQRRSGSPDILQGTQAYSHKQAYILCRMASRCALEWLPVLKKEGINPDWEGRYLLMSTKFGAKNYNRRSDPLQDREAVCEDGDTVFQYESSSDEDGDEECKEDIEEEFDDFEFDD